MPGAMTNKPYAPVSCELHSELELAIMRRQPLQIDWLDAEHHQQSSLLIPQDIVIRDHCEYLRATDMQRSTFDIRLDSITQFCVDAG